MTNALWCVMIAALMPLAGSITAKLGSRMPIRANHHVREWLAGLDGWAKRAHWFQLNSLEAFPMFAAAVLTAQYLHAPQMRIDQLAIAFIGLRLAYFVFYLADWATLRTLVWTGGFACTIALFVTGA
ncbi:MAPEG family protein [Burkholderia sp. Ac-20353]|uniref:MAPEG family protein n=1 Tax=Burkholderia sp. Ac-20353 TaxID=2703894 RepID=UPI00197C8102|nr:MAPEG family protein [Burkholderia sp. Ac-20353]MBN3786367.1 hypothetical protein [Burkholderia sp. Ac-20353]